MAQQPPILVLPLAPDLPLVNVLARHHFFLSGFLLIERKPSEAKMATVDLKS